jgi:hypothetical protein
MIPLFFATFPTKFLCTCVQLRMVGVNDVCSLPRFLLYRFFILIPLVQSSGMTAAFFFRERVTAAIFFRERESYLAALAFCLATYLVGWMYFAMHASLSLISIS